MWHAYGRSFSYQVSDEWRVFPLNVYVRSRFVRFIENCLENCHFVRRSKGYRRTDGSTVGFLSQASCESTIDGVDLRECKVALCRIELNGVLELCDWIDDTVVDRLDIFSICIWN